jgi:hypothetical protein
MAFDRSRTSERLARIESLIAEYQAVKQRRLLRTAIRLWHKAQSRQRHAELDTRPERVH